MGIQVTSLHIYPLKSAGPVNLDHADIGSRGLAWDRRWLLVDHKGRFLTARRYTTMLQMDISGSNGAFTVEVPGKGSFKLPLPTSNHRICVRVWKSKISAAWCGHKADAFFSQALGMPCRLVFMDDIALRLTNPKFSSTGDQVGFADGYPILLTTQQSLDALNSELKDPVLMHRFRPNIVVDGSKHAWDEDNWLTLTSNRGELRISNPCVRCIMTTVDWKTGQKHEHKEPLNTLERLHSNHDGEAIFGQNIIARTIMKISTGDSFRATT